MKIVVDENLPRRVVSWLADQGHDAVHVADLGLGGASDQRIWNAAVERGAFILTRDGDFVSVARNTTSAGVIRLSIGNCSTRSLVSWLNANWPLIAKRLNAGERLIEQ